jgi:hypothetical protein
MDAQEVEYYESFLNYYKTKTIQLEHDFVSYKIKTEQHIRELNKNIENLVVTKEKNKKG